MIFILVAGVATQDAIHRTVHTTIPVCGQTQIVSFTDKPNVELCADILATITPPIAVFYANLISSVVIFAVFITVVYAAYITNRDTKDVKTVNKIGKYVKSYYRNADDNISN